MGRLQTRPTRGALRRAWVQLHVWIGVIAGLVVAVIAITGAILTLSGPLTRMENRDLLFAGGREVQTADWLDIDLWIENALRSHPGMEIEGAYAPGATPVRTNSVLLVAHSHGADGEFAGHVVMPVDPDSRSPLGTSLYEATWAGIVMTLHTSLLADVVGSEVIAWATVFILLSAGAGVYLWWPRAGEWRAALSVPAAKTGRRAWLAWHNFVAVWFVVPLLLLIVSGLYFLKPQWIDPIIHVVSDVREPDFEASATGSPRCSATLSLGDAVALAQQRFPDLAMRAAVIPEEIGAPFYVSMMPPGGDARAFSTELWVDRHCREILFVRRGDSLTAGEWLFSEMRPIHADLKLGAFGAVLTGISGVALFALFVTGIVMFFRWRLRGLVRAG